jgi:ABC-type phosphate/phosphonate transport system ATPase subunit
MHQIMIRIILAHLVIAESGSLTTEVEEIIKEIGYIYPALKAEISFASQEINLVDWLELYLTQLIKEKSPGPLFYRFL